MLFAEEVELGADFSAMLLLLGAEKADLLLMLFAKELELGVDFAAMLLLLGFHLVEPGVDFLPMLLLLGAEVAEILLLFFAGVAKILLLLFAEMVKPGVDFAAIFPLLFFQPVKPGIGFAAVLPLLRNEQRYRSFQSSHSRLNANLVCCLRCHIMLPFHRRGRRRKRRRRPVSFSGASAYPPFWLHSSSSTAPGDIGRLSIRTPTAAWMALAMAAMGGTIGTSPTPRTP